VTVPSSTNEELQTVHLRIPVSARYFRVARVVAGALADELGADIDELDDVRLAVGEICSLALASNASEVDLQFELTDDALILRGLATASSTASTVTSASPTTSST
jgi:anti-sigma regulatory factor (Ser/Thr protein kinase)